MSENHKVEGSKSLNKRRELQSHNKSLFRGISASIQLMVSRSFSQPIWNISFIRLVRLLLTIVIVVVVENCSNPDLTTGYYLLFIFKLQKNSKNLYFSLSRSFTYIFQYAELLFFIAHSIIWSLLYLLFTILRQLNHSTKKIVIL